MLVPVFQPSLELTIQWPALTGPTFGIPTAYIVLIMIIDANMMLRG